MKQVCELNPYLEKTKQKLLFFLILSDFIDEGSVVVAFSHVGIAQSVAYILGAS
jgi:hypothetical protein